MTGNGAHMRRLQDRVVVVTGAGEKAFASGADISEFGEQRTDPAARAEFDRGMAAIARGWASLDKPVIARCCTCGSANTWSIR